MYGVYTTAVLVILSVKYVLLVSSVLMETEHGVNKKSRESNDVLHRSG